MKMSFEEFYGYMAQRGQGFLLDLGDSCIGTASLVGVGASGVTDAMQKQARQSQGQVAQYDDGYPKGSEFFDSLMGKDLSWPVSRIAATAGNIAKTGAEKVADIGTTAIAGYLSLTALASIAGIIIVILSFRKK